MKEFKKMLESMVKYACEDYMFRHNATSIFFKDTLDIETDKYIIEFTFTSETTATFNVKCLDFDGAAIGGGNGYVTHCGVHVDRMYFLTNNEFINNGRKPLK